MFVCRRGHRVLPAQKSCVSWEMHGSYMNSLKGSNLNKFSERVA